MSNGTCETDLCATEHTHLRIGYGKKEDHVNSPNTVGHVHGCYELYVYMQGEVSFVVENRVFHLQTGDLVLSAPHSYHHCICHRDCIHEHFCLFFSSADERVNALLQTLSRDTLLHLEEELFRELTDTLFGFLAIHPDSETAWVAQQAQFYRLLTLLASAVGGKETPPPPNALPEPLRQMLLYIGENYATITRITQLCERYFISQSTVERLFREYLHTTPRRYIESVRLAAACRALSEGKSVTESALESGFADCSHFAALFRRRFHKTPLQYRRETVAGRMTSTPTP